MAAKEISTTGSAGDVHTGDVMGGDIQRFLEQSGRPFLRKPLPC